MTSHCWLFKMTCDISTNLETKSNMGNEGVCFHNYVMCNLWTVPQINVWRHRWMFTGQSRVSSKSNNFVDATIKSKLSFLFHTTTSLVGIDNIYLFCMKVSCRRRRLHKKLNLQRCVIKFLHFFFVKFHLQKPPMSDQSTLFFERLKILVSTYWNTLRSTNMKSFISCIEILTVRKHHLSVQSEMAFEQQTIRRWRGMIIEILVKKKNHSSRVFLTSSSDRETF